MEPVTVNPLSQLENIPNEQLTLDQARDKMNELLLFAEVNAWDVGDLLNAIESTGLVQSGVLQSKGRKKGSRKKGYGKTRAWLEAEVPRAHGKTSTLYKYADVAANYTKEQAKSWGMAKLYELIVHDGKTEGQPVPGDPADRDIQLFQEDGLTLGKKFRDCTYRDLQRSNMRMRKAGKGPDQAEAKVPSSSKTPVGIAQAPVRSAKMSLAVMGLGILLAGISEYLPYGVVSTWLFVLGTVLTLTSAGVLLRHWRVWRDRLLSAVKDGKARAFLKEQFAKVRQQIKSSAGAFHRWLMKTDHAPSAQTTTGEEKTTSNEEKTPPPERKAA